MKLQRILEPEVMDSPKEAQEYNEMDHSKVNEVFVTDLLAFLNEDESQRLRLADESSWGEVRTLDLGTGTALIPIELCTRCEAFRVMGIDMAISMLDLARYNVEVSDYAERIELDRVDAKTMEFDDEAFEVVISNSIVHHLPDPVGCLEQIRRVTQTGGAIFIRDLMRPNDLETLESIVQTYAGEETKYSQKLFRASLHAALSLEEIRAMVADLGFDPASVVASSDRHWTWATRN